LSTLLKQFAKGINQSEFIFKTTKDALHTELRICCEKINHKKMRIHDFRHSHASYLIQTGTNLLEVSHRLGHKNLYTTLRTYAHYIPELPNSIPNRLEELWSSLQ
jgi:integrase